MLIISVFYFLFSRGCNRILLFLETSRNIPNIKYKTLFLCILCVRNKDVHVVLNYINRRLVKIWSIKVCVKRSYPKYTFKECHLTYERIYRNNWTVILLILNLRVGQRISQVRRKMFKYSSFLYQPINKSKNKNIKVTKFIFRNSIKYK